MIGWSNASFQAVQPGEEIKYQPGFGNRNLFYEWKNRAATQGKVTRSNGKYYRAFLDRDGQLTAPGAADSGLNLLRRIGGRKTVFPLIQQVVEFFNEVGKFGLIGLGLNLEHELIHPFPLFWGHGGEFSR